MKIEIIKVVSSIIIIALICSVQNLLNAKKNRRIRQFPWIIITIILSIVGVVLLTKYYDYSDYVTQKAEFLVHANLLIINVTLILAITLLKIIVRPIVTALCKKRETLELFSNTLYYFDDEYDEWFLKRQWVGFRKYFFGIVCGMVLTSSVYLGLTWALGPEHPIWMFCFPCAALAIMNEIYAYINGQTKEEFSHSVLGDDADARRINNYYKLREILEQILPEPLLSAHTGFEFLKRETPSEMFKNLKDSEETRDKITAEYFELNNRYKTADADCVQATIDMMHRRNVVFFNPFYRDLSMYLTLPIVHALLSGKKCVVLCGRKNTADDIKHWISDLLSEYSRMPSLWRVENLSDREIECEVGIITFTQIYDKRVITTNKEFFKETDFVLLIEPSVMLNTSQIALSLLAEEMNYNDEKPVYCICDRYTDGLIDTMSHLLQSEITDVIAMPVPHCNYTVMAWDADGDFNRQQLFDKQTKYLGDGIELGAIAIKNQVPSVTWYSETKAPIKDIKWIAGQHYATICRYMNQPSQQKCLYDKINFVSMLWNSTKTKEQFVIVEDEFCNMFNTMRAFLSRGENQIFVNVLSENYLLRDYMRCNRQMFMANPNAVPSCVPDYAKTERNTIMKLILKMTLQPVTEEEVFKELHLVGIESDDAYKSLLDLLRRYTFADDTLFTVRSVRTNLDEFTTVSTNIFSVTDEEFEKYFSDSLKNAYYILEDEKSNQGYIDAKMYSHVTQTILPGQFVTYDGKYYQAKYVSPQSGVVLRRASDLYDGRKYYRQVRNYYFDLNGKSEIISVRKVMDIEFTELRTDFYVVTTGYLELKDNHNLRTARLIDFTNDPATDSFTRRYRNKSVLRIQLPESTDKICFTVCLLLSEVFKSVFPDGWQYIAAITKRPDDIDGILNYVVYPASGDVEPGYIYIVEDSDVDLGLLDAVEKNFMRLMEIIADFLEWHFEKMREPASKDPVPVKISVAEREEKKRRNLVVRMFDRIRKLFGNKKEEAVNIKSVEKVENSEDPANTQNESETQTSSSQVDKPEENGTYELNGDDTEKAEVQPIASVEEDSEGDFTLGEEEPETSSTDNSMEMMESSVDTGAGDTNEEHPEDEFEIDNIGDPDLVHIDGTDIFDNEGMPEDNDYLELSFQEIGLTPLTKSRYQKECYLKYGYEEIDGRIQVEELRQYLRVRGWSNSSLTLARKRDITVKPTMNTGAVNHCDFCFLPLTGVSYERLNDGRIRCNDCSSSAITTIEEFRDLFYRCLEMMEDFYEIKYRVPISVKMTNAKEIAKGAGMVFKPSTGVADRVLGYAQQQNDKYTLIVENGSPRLATIDTIVHEMTHIWQYLNWNDKDIISIYGMNQPSCTAKAKDILYEGMAMWASIQYLYQIGENYYAARQEALAESRPDIYGIGFRLYRDQYPLVKDSSLLKYSPFSTFPTLEPQLVYNAVRLTCEDKECRC